RLDGHLSERVLRDAVEKTFRGAARGAQGVFAVHQHGGHDRPAHPHVHALLSPRFENRMAVHISPVRIQRIKERWEREVLSVSHPGRCPSRFAIFSGCRAVSEVSRFGSDRTAGEWRYSPSSIVSGGMFSSRDPSRPLLGSTTSTRVP